MQYQLGNGGPRCELARWKPRCSGGGRNGKSAGSAPGAETGGRSKQIVVAQTGKKGDVAGTAGTLMPSGMTTGLRHSP